MITVKTFANYIDANMAADSLRQHNINCFLADEYSAASSMAPSLVGVRIMVDEEDLNRAKLVLDELSY